MPEEHIVPRNTFIDAYIESAVALLKANRPNEDENKLRSFVQKLVQKKYTPASCDVIVNPSYGNAELRKNVDVLKFFNHYNQDVLTPSGSVYYTVNKKVSLIRNFVKHFLDSRKKLKKEMLKAEEAGDTVKAKIKHYGQYTMKVRANSIIGGTGNEYSFCYNKAAFNSVTSLSRNTTITAYAFTERFLVGNFYFPTYNHFLNYL